MRRNRPVPVLTLMVGLGLALPLQAQAQAQNATAAWQATPASMLKHALRDMVAAQDTYRARHPVFASSVEALQLQAGPDIKIQILSAASSGWRGKATHRARPGRSCVVFVGQVNGLELPKTDADGEMAGEERVPLCDRME